MPQAVPQLENDAYGYVVKATVAQVGEFYDREMLKLGWQSLVGTLGQGGLFLMYTKAGEKVTIMVMPAKYDQTMVLIEAD